MGNPEAVNFDEFVVHSCVPSEKFFKKLDRDGKVINKHPDCMIVHGFYRGNPNYCTIVSKADVGKLRSITQKDFNDLVAEVKRLGEVVEKKGK